MQKIKLILLKSNINYYNYHMFNFKDIMQSKLNFNHFVIFGKQEPKYLL